MRKVAREVGATPMALYRHVEDREDLLTEMLDSLLADEPLPDAAAPAEWALHFARWLRGFLLRHDWALELYVRKPIVTPRALERMDRSLAHLTRAGLPEQEAAELFGLTTTFVVGFTAVEAGRRREQGTSESWRTFFGRLDRDSYPALAHLAPEARNYIDEDGFERGVSALVAGLLEPASASVSSPP